MRIISWTDKKRTITLKEVDDATIKKAANSIIRAAKQVRDIGLKRTIARSGHRLQAWP